MLLRITLALILLTASVVVAPARGQMAAMSVTICADGGPQTIMLDAQGKPVGPHAPCPECLPGLTAGMLPQTALSQRMAFARLLSLPLLRRIETASALAICATARGPPVLV